MTTDLRFRADAVDMDEAKTTAHLVGHVTVEIPNRGTLTADEADYDLISGDLSLKLKVTPAH
ncbi:MAG TPA: hypothetical protein VHW24_09950 [Bryobacteraceae bacterium]|nr:hypothetical protein [Bryobacteraceae bacterium]